MQSLCKAVLNKHKVIYLTKVICNRQLHSEQAVFFLLVLAKPLLLCIASGNTCVCWIHFKGLMKHTYTTLHTLIQEKKKELNWSLSTFDWSTINNEEKLDIVHVGVPRWHAAMAYLKLKGENTLGSKVLVGFAAATLDVIVCCQTYTVEQYKHKGSMINKSFIYPIDLSFFSQSCGNFTHHVPSTALVQNSSNSFSCRLIFHVDYNLY